MAPALAPTRALRAALYLRVSTVGQEQDGTSLDTQEAADRAHAAKLGAVVDEAHVYREVFTGVELWERPKLTALRQAIRQRLVNVVIVYAIDRLARDPVHLGVVISEAEHAGVEVEFVTEPLDHSPEGQLIRFVRGYAAKVEHEKIKERTYRGRLARVAAGKPLAAGKPPYGYQWADADKSTLVVDPTAAPIVRRLFAGVLGGSSLRALALALQSEGVLSPTGGVGWSMSTVRYILTNPVYTGRLTALRWRTAKVNGTHRREERPADEQRVVSTTLPAIVDEATFHAVAHRLTRNHAYATRNNHDPEATLLRSGFARCGQCGRWLQAFYHRATGSWRYKCQQRVGQAECTPRPCINAADLDTAAWRRVAAVLADPQTIAAELERQRGDDPTAADLSAVEQALSDIARKQRKAAQAVTLLDDDAGAPLLAELASLARQKQQLEAERETLRTRRASWEAAQARLGEMSTWCRGVAAKIAGLTYAERRLALEALGVDVKLWPTGHAPRYEITASIPLGTPIVNSITCDS